MRCPHDGPSLGGRVLVDQGSPGVARADVLEHPVDHTSLGLEVVPVAPVRELSHAHVDLFQRVRLQAVPGVPQPRARNGSPIQRKLFVDGRQTGWMVGSKPTDLIIILKKR